MNRFGKIWWLLLGLGLFLACSSDPIQNGDKAFNNNEFGEALKYYLEAYRQDTESPQLRQKIVLTYAKLGEDYYKKRKVIKAFQAKMDEGLKYLPAELSPAFKKQLSDIHLTLARAYINQEPQNFMEKRANFENALANLEKSVDYNPQNMEAVEELQRYNEQHFEEILERGMTYFERGKANKSDYFLAEKYLEKALSLKPDHTEARQKLMLARKETLSLLKMDQELPFAISDRIKKGNVLSFFIVIHNNGSENREVDASHFVLISQNNEIIGGYKGTGFSNAFEAALLKPGEEARGVVSFNISASENYIRLEYRTDDTVKGSKNLPI